MCMDMNYCRRCGENLTQVSEAYTCTNGHTLYNNPIPGVAIFLVNPERTHVTLAIRAFEPGIGKLNAIGGFMDLGETAEEALYRELQEEVGLSPQDISEPRYIGTAISYYHHHDETRQVLCIAYWATPQPGTTLQPSDDVAEIQTYPLDAIPFDQFQSVDDVAMLKKLQQLLTTQER